MDIQTLLHNLHEEVSCSVCRCKFTDPKLLPCLHTFCLKCLSRIQRTSGSREAILCPECRREVIIPGGGDLNALPTNLKINRILDVLAIKECDTSGVKCGNCENKSEKSSYCFQCCSFWCDDCISFHNGIKANKEHYALALKDLQDRDFENILRRPVYCEKPGHEKKELEFFCKNCEVAICYSCIATLHEGHAKILLDEAANERKLLANSAIDSQKQKVLQKRSRIAKLQSNCVNIQAQVETVKRDVQRFADDMIAVIEAKKQEIFNDVEKKANELLERLGIQQSEVENQIKLIETEIERTETLLKRSTNAKIVRLHKNFQEGVSDEEEQLDCDLEGFRYFVFVESETLMQKANSEGIGLLRTLNRKTKADQSSAEGKGISEATLGLEAQIVVTTRNDLAKQCYEERDYVTVEIRNRQGHDCATKAQVQDTKDGTYKISYFAKETGTCQASVKVNGEHVRGSPFEVQVKPRQYRPVLSFGQLGSSAGMFNYPWGIAVNERNEIAVTSDHIVQVFSSNGTHLRSFGRKGNNQGEFDFPAGIAFHNDNIIVVDNGNHRVQLFSDQGKYLGQFGGEGSLDHHLKHSQGLSIDSDGNIIVADRDNKLIKIFSQSGQFLRKIGTGGSFTLPFHCVQHDNYLIVSDSGDHCVTVLDREGKVLYKFGKKGVGDGEFNEPHCLSVNKAGHLLVCDSGNHRIQVFELSGKFVTKFGKEGSGIGEFKNPVSVVVLSTGRIVVSDFNNHRIQVFE